MLKWLGLIGRTSRLEPVGGSNGNEAEAIAALSRRQYFLDIDSDGFVTSVMASSSHGVSDDDLLLLKKFSRLSNLTIVAHDFRLPQFTDRGLASVGELSGLEVLLMGYNPLISDEGLRPLGKLTRLKTLAINNTDISDAGLQHLRKLSALRTLNVRGTRVTRSGVKALEKALPDCKIDNKQA